METGSGKFLTVRGAARLRTPLDGSDARALEAALSQVERELSVALETRHSLEVELEKARVEAFKALGRYKFQMFGYWAAIWVHLNRLCPVIGGRPNPFYSLVAMARRTGNGSDESATSADKGGGLNHRDTETQREGG